MSQNNKEKRAPFTTMGARNYAITEREKNDFYSTNPESLEIFLKALERDGFELHKRVWECACGMGHLSEVLKSKGYDVASTDLINRGYGTTGVDFLFDTLLNVWNGDILTNPPYKYAKQFVEHALDIIGNGYYVIMFLKIQFLEGKDRRKLFDKYPPKYVYINSARQTCYIDGNMDKKMSSAICFCWFIWEKGFTGEPTIRWI